MSPTLNLKQNSLFKKYFKKPDRSLIDTLKDCHSQEITQNNKNE